MDPAGRSLLLLYFEKLNNAGACEDERVRQIDNCCFPEHLYHVLSRIVVEKRNLEKHFLKCTLWPILTAIEPVTATSFLANDFMFTGEPMTRSRIPPVVYWIQFTLTSNDPVSFVPNLVDQRTCAGVQICTKDVNIDGHIDILSPSKLGTLLLINQPAGNVESLALLMR